MVTIQKRSIYDCIVDGIRKAKELASPILISSTTSVKDMDPLLFYRAGEKAFSGVRFYWKEPQEQNIIVGLGALKVIQSNEKTSKRFKSIEAEWESVLQSSIQLKSLENKTAGPFLVGGFAFDPTKSKTQLWKDFPEAKFYLPKYSLAIEDGQGWLTTNLFVSEYDDSDQVYKTLTTEEKSLLLEMNKHMNAHATPLSINEREIEVDDWLKSVETVVSHINEGRLEKAVLARELKLQANEEFNILSILSNLVENQPSSYIFAIESGGSTFVGATPERLIKKKNDQVLSTCLAGSIKRGSTLDEDKLLANSLLQDPKNLVEHKFVVDMITKELNAVCSSITKPSKPAIFKARDIQHLYTPIVGKVKENVNLLSIVERLHPTPALGGYPQKKALEEIRAYELLDRGWYAGPIGWLDGNGNGEFAVAIRSGLVQKKEASLFAGCGIVAKSEASKEYEETNIKFKPMLAAIGGKINGR